MPDGEERHLLQALHLFGEVGVFTSPGLDLLQRVLEELDPSPYLRAWTRAWLAVAHHHTGEPARARELLIRIETINQQWGLNPDGSLPDSVGVSFDTRAND